MIPFPEEQGKLSGTNFVYLGTASSTYEYLAKDTASFTVSDPPEICSHFTVTGYLFVYFSN